MSRTESNCRSDWQNVGRACDTWYCILIIKFYIEPGFPEIQAGKRLWLTRWRRKTAHWNADILKDRGLRMLLIRRARKVSNRVSSYLSGFELTYWDTMTGNSSNDRLILHQNVEINSDWPTPDPPQTIRCMIWNHTISLQTIQFSDQTIQFYYKPYNCLSNHLKHELGK